MSEEHQLAPVDRMQAWKAALVVGLSAIICSLIPLAPFVVLSVGSACGSR
jgi:VIT1/CCC1 family predicted Fe2+/Mn2+ transporter